MNLNKCLLLIFVLITISFGVPNNDNVKMEVRVYFKDITELYTKLGEFFSELDIATREENEKGEPYLVIITNQKQIEQIRAAGFKVEITYSDIKDKFRLMTGVDPNNVDMLRDFGYFFTYWEMIDTLNHLDTNFSSIANVFSPGSSYQGKPLWTLKISDNPLTDEPEPAVYINGATHAREPGATHCCIDFATYLLRNYGQDSLVTWLVNNREIFITPVMNPDGYVYNSDSGGAVSNWRKSRRIWVAPSIGVDLNRNYGYRWGVDNVGSSPTPSSETYRGPTRFSDIETQVARDFMLNQKIRTQIDYHTFGQYNLYPWSYATLAPPESLLFKEIVDTFRFYNQYSASRTGQCSRVLYLANGCSDDWEYADTLHQGNQKFITYATSIEWGRTDFWYGWNLPAYVDSECLKNRPNSLYLTRLAGVFFEPRGVLINDSLRGNMTNQLDPSETAHVWFKLRNRAVHPLDSAYQLSGKLKSLDTMVIILDSIKTFPTCRRRDSTNNRFQQFKFYCRSSTNPGRVVTLRLEMSYKDDTLTMMQPVNFTITIGSNPILTHDVGCTKLEGFAAIVDSATILTPACSVYNYGTATENYSVRLKVGNFYNRTASVTVHLPNTQRYITFPACTTYQRGVNAVSCSTELSGDLVPSNDKRTVSFFTRVVDVGTIVITSPPPVIDSGSIVTPKAQVKNFGNTTVNNIPVRFSIGLWQDDTIIASLTANESTLVTFADWTALPRGRLVTSCSTRLVNDMNNTNDKQTDSVLVRVLDVGTTAILAPPLVVDSGQTIAPQTRVKNFGNITANDIPVRFDIDTWQDDTTIVSLAANESTVVTFADWTAMERGFFATKCSTRLTGDINSVNDKKTGSVSVGVEDVGIVAFPLPDTVNSGANVTPVCTLFNFGTAAETYNVFLRINGSDPETLLVTGHLPATYLSITFANRIIQPGLNTFSCSLAINDMNPTNDTMTKNVFGRFSDVGVTKIEAPTGGYFYMDVVTPACSVYNYGNTPETYWVRMKIGDFYNDTAQIINHNPGTYQYITFPIWTATQIGTHTVSCSTELVLDANTANDKQEGSVFVIRIQEGWVKMADINFGEKPVSKGGCLASFPDSAWIYTLKGNNKPSFGHYSIPNNAWTQLADMPFALDKEKKPKAGAAMVRSGNYLYATKGGNRLEFWHYGLPGADSLGWKQLPDVPAGAKKVKGGTVLAAVKLNDTDYIFMAKGSKTNEGYLFNIRANAWGPALPNVPLFDKSTSGCGFNESLVYAITYDKGTKTNSMFMANLKTNTWTKPATVPLIGSSGKRKKIKEGSALTTDGTKFYMFKGGNVKEFFDYLPGESVMPRMDIPLTTKKGVKGGAALAFANGYVWALPGNKLNEFWQYTPVPPTIASVTNSPSFEGTMGNKLANDEFKLAIVPNPAINLTTARYSLPIAGPVNLRLYNVLGVLVKSFANSNPTKQGMIKIDGSVLPAGVYILRFNSAGFSVSRKLVIEK